MAHAASNHSHCNLHPQCYCVFNRSNLLMEAIPVPKIYPFLWFDSQAEEAANLYCSIFPNSKIGKIARYGKGGPGPEGAVMTVSFSLDGQEFTALPPALASNSPKQFPSSFHAKIKMKLTTTGRSSPQTA